jgi:hypothetical protein
MAAWTLLLRFNSAKDFGSKSYLLHLRTIGPRHTRGQRVTERRGIRSAEKGLMKKLGPRKGINQCVPLRSSHLLAGTCNNFYQEIPMDASI